MLIRALLVLHVPLYLALWRHRPLFILTSARCLFISLEVFLISLYPIRLLRVTIHLVRNTNSAYFCDYHYFTFRICQIFSPKLL